MSKIAIVGGGIGGMAAAYELAKRGQQITLFETDGQLGGMARGFKKKGWQWSVEEFYHHWFQSDRAFLGLAKELGVDHKVQFHRPKTVVYHHGDFYPLDSPVAALLFPGFSLLDKMRFGVVTAYLRYLSNWPRFEKYKAVDWIKKYYGLRLYETLYEPLLVGKFDQYYDQVNMAWFWARFKSRTSKLGTYVGGFQAFIDEFAQILKKFNVEIKLHTSVHSIRTKADGRLTLTTKDDFDFDQVLVTTSPYALAKMAPELEETYRQKLLSLKSIGAVNLILSLKYQLSINGYYWFNLPKRAGFPFLALVEHTNFVSPAYFNNEHIVYCGDYLEPTHEYFQLSKEELIERFIPSLSRINPQFTPEWVQDSWLFRLTYAQPIPTVNHSVSNLPEIRTPMKNLFFASMSQVYPWDRGTNYAIDLGRQAAKLMGDQ
jgi:protoporphyrinogen oxidase